MMNNPDYPFEIRPLTKDEGNGWLITFPDLLGCMSDGETPEEAIINGEDAKQCWIQACREAGRKIPQPGESKQLMSATIRAHGQHAATRHPI
jgi:antitoxin HicB